MRDEAMTAAETADIPALMREIGVQAKTAARTLASAPTAVKRAALRGAATALRGRLAEVTAANAEDMAFGREKGLSSAMLDRLRLDGDRIEGIAAGLEAVAAGEDPVGEVLAEWRRPNGLRIKRVATPLGVIGVIYESRPNVTADAAALCLASGNAVILRGGSESFHSSRAIHAALVEGLREAGLPEHAAQIVPTRDRAAVGEMLGGMTDWLDVIVPRGGRSLVERVQREARTPVFAHLEGICHVYVDRAADLEKAVAIVVNAKMRRTGICGAAECLLIDRAAAETHLAALVDGLTAAGCEVRADVEARLRAPSTVAAQPEDFGHEFLDAVIALKLVDGVDGAIEHIRTHGSGHTEAVITEDDAVAARFFAELDSAVLMRNASTQFADGGEFGMGAEIGIATGKIHARGPIGARQLTSFKYLVEAEAAIRP